MARNLNSQSIVLDRFFDLRRGHLSLMDYLTEYQLHVEETALVGGLAINDIGKTHLFA